MTARRTERFWIMVALMAGALLAAACGDVPAAESEALDVAEALSADTSGYARADRPRRFDFPADHGPHPDFRTEWWYYTGNLRSADGRRFGYQFTIFRTALRPPHDAVEAEGSWATHQLYMAHFALTDVASGGFHAGERFSRTSADLAGAHGEPYRVWLEDWEAAAVDSSFDTQRLRASMDGVGVDLRLNALKPIVLQGEDGLDPKGPEPGNASYYYAVTRWETSGTVEVDGAAFAVTGTSWLDREWSTSVLAEGIRGWDWFALQLDDGRDIMYYQLRDDDGRPSSFSGGVIVDRDGRRTPFTLAESELTVTDRWPSPRGGTYPSGWRLEVPREGIALRIDPVVKNQELDVSVRYWEGAVDVAGSVAGTDVRGVGYAELTGYAERARSQLARH